MRNNFCLRFRKLKVDIFKKMFGNDEVYDLYIKKEKLINLLNNLLDKDLENYYKIFNFFESININT